MEFRGMRMQSILILVVQFLTSGYYSMYRTTSYFAVWSKLSVKSMKEKLVTASLRSVRNEQLTNIYTQPVTADWGFKLISVLQSFLAVRVWIVITFNIVMLQIYLWFNWLCRNLNSLL